MHEGPTATATPVEDRWAMGLLAGALLALILRYVWAGDASLTYNEATYVELAAHPWWSAYYPDTVFVRHPPLSFLVMWAWISAFGAEEWVVRGLALLLSLGGVGLSWDAARRSGGSRAALVVGAVMLAAFPLHAYALQATMYPFAFLLAAWAVWARIVGRTWTEGWAYSLLALTHLFGLLFLALWVWEHRTAWRLWSPVVAPVAAWLVAAVAMGLLFNVEGDVMRLGPLGQVLRTMTTAEKAVAVRPLVNLTSAALAVWTLNLVLLWTAARARRTYPGWSIAVGVLVLYFFVAAPFPRYALIPLPFVAVVGAVMVARSMPDVRAWARPVPALAVAMALSSLPLGFVYLEEGPDPRAAGDVPGLQDWQGAVARLPAEATTIATSGPTATAYYLEDDGWDVVDRTEAPYRILLEEDGETRHLTRVDAVSDLDGSEADAWIVPVHWDDVSDAADGEGLIQCDEVDGLVLYARSC